jgi:hypothetical protein
MTEQEQQLINELLRWKQERHEIIIDFYKLLNYDRYKYDN